MNSKMKSFDFPADWDSMKIVTINDVHYGDDLSSIAKFRTFIQMIKDDPRFYVICLGDLINNNLKSSKGNCHEDIMSPQEQKKGIIKELTPIKDKILYMVSGNHEYRTNKEAGSDPTEDIAMVLGVPYERDGAIFKVTLGKDKHNKRVAYVISAFHGQGGGRKVSAGLNIAEDFLSCMDGVDIITIGHTHKLTSGRISSLRVDPKNNCITQIDKLIVVGGHWVEYGGYAERGMMRPSPVGPGVIMLDGTKKEFHSMV